MHEHLKAGTCVALHDNLLFRDINILMARAGRLGISMDLEDS
jgi:hypothetical protein